MVKIVTHPGGAHRDEFLACCFLLSAYPQIERIERRNPTTEDLADPRTFVVDVGGLHQPHLSNFDHHQLPREAPATCSLTLVLEHLGLLTLARDVFPWLTLTEILDSKGPFAAAEHLGCSRESFQETLSPIEVSILRVFEQQKVVEGRYWELLAVMRAIGDEKREYLRKIRDRINLLADNHASTIRFVNGVMVFDASFVDRKDDPTLGLEIYLKRNRPDVAVTITQDDRGDGLCLFRRNDDPRVDFSYLEGKPGVVFAHKGGFVAKLSPGANVDALIDSAIVTVVSDYSRALDTLDTTRGVMS